MLNNLFEKRAISQSLWAQGFDYDGLATEAGVSINSENALTINAVFSAVSLISDTISTLPVAAYERTTGERRYLVPQPVWVNRPDIELPSNAFWQSVLVSLLLDGNSFTRVWRDEQGEVVNLTQLNPYTVQIKRNAVGGLMFIVDGVNKPLTKDEIIWIPDLLKPGATRGVARVEALKENFGLALALQNFAARFFGQGASMAGVIEFPTALTAEQAKNLSAAFDNRHGGWRKSGRTGVLSGGATFKPTSASNDQSQMIESRRLAVEDVARVFNMPPHLLALPGFNSYASVEQSNIQFTIHTVRPLVAKLESAFGWLLPKGAFLKWNLDGLLRGDFSSRMQGYSVGSQAGFLSINDIRRLEDLPSVDSGDVYRVPLANVNLTAADLAEQNERVAMAQKLIAVGFDPADVLAKLNLPPIAHTGVPSASLQSVAQIDPTDPSAVYGAN